MKLSKVVLSESWSITEQTICFLESGQFIQKTMDFCFNEYKLYIEREYVVINLIKSAMYFKY